MKLVELYIKGNTVTIVKLFKKSPLFRSLNYDTCDKEMITFILSYGGNKAIKHVNDIYKNGANQKHRILQALLEIPLHFKDNPETINLLTPILANIRLHPFDEFLRVAQSLIVNLGQLLILPNML